MAVAATEIVAANAHGIVFVPVAASPLFPNPPVNATVSAGGTAINDFGVAIGVTTAVLPGNPNDPSNHITQAITWNSDGSGNVLGTLPAPTDGYGGSSVVAINDAGVIFGSTTLYAGGVAQGTRAVRWTTGATPAMTVLGIAGPGTKGDFVTVSSMNQAGTGIGYEGWKTADGTDGFATLRWDPGQTTPTILGNIGTYADGSASCTPRAINAAGVIVGDGQSVASDHQTFNGFRAVRWEAGQTTPELMGQIANESGFVGVAAINASGTSAGYESVLNPGNGRYAGRRAVRWDGVTATELGTLAHRTTDDYADATASAINDAGVIVGTCTQYNGSASVGSRAIRWDAGSTTAIELKGLDPKSTDGYVGCDAFDINSGGLIVGASTRFLGTTSLTSHGVFWMPGSTTPTDVNTLNLVPVEGGAGVWELTSIVKISADGWMVGGGMYDPDGAGAQPATSRGWSAQLTFGGIWTTASGTWGRGTNWNTGTPAGLLGYALFNRAGNTTVSLDHDQTTQSIEFASPSGGVTLDLAGHVLTSQSEILLSQGTLVAGSSVAGGQLAGGLQNGGTLQPGLGVGTLHIGGEYFQTFQGTLGIEVGSVAIGSDLLDVGGIAQLGNKLVLTWVGALPTTGDAGREIVHAGTLIASRFATITGVSLSATESLAVTYQAHSVIVTVARPGDVTLDGKVGFADLVPLAQNYNLTTTGQTWSTGDLNGDGKTNFSDLVILAQNYGFGAASLAGDNSGFSAGFAADWALAQSLAPEPTTLSALAVAMVVVRRRRVPSA